MGTAAACSNESPVGFASSVAAGTAAYSAKAPPLRHRLALMLRPKTSSPGRNRVTFVPSDSTVPARSVPGTGCFGARNPEPIARRT